MANDVKTDVKILDGAGILNAPDLALELVAVPEWGGSVYVRGMSGDARDRYDVAATDDDGKPILTNFRSRLLALTLCDESGKLLFTELDVEKLAKKSSTAILRLFAVARRLNKIGAEEVATEKKDSSEVRSGDSPTDSR